MALRSWCKNRKAATTSLRCREVQKRSIPTSRCSGLVLGQFSTNFELIIEGFKGQTIETQGGGGGGGGTDFRRLLGRTSSLWVETLWRDF